MQYIVKDIPDLVCKRTVYMDVKITQSLNIGKKFTIKLELIMRSPINLNLLYQSKRSLVLNLTSVASNVVMPDTRVVKITQRYS